MRQETARELVSVVIPLHDGVATIERTLRSVCRQTWRELEIIVVDDGSADEGPAIVAQAQRSDPRIRLIRQGNAGVAAARNAGAACSRGRFLAFVDSDDLWAAEKIALQMAAMKRAGPKVGLVYTWAAIIDASDRVFSLAHRPEAEGWIFPELCRANVVGNGSSTLIRREAFERVGGYDPTLRARGAQGCEDLMIYLLIAEHYEFRVLRHYLTGYRVTPQNMSSDALTMLRSCELTLAAFEQRYPQYAAEFASHRRNMVYWLIARALTTGPVHNVGALLAKDGFLRAFILTPRVKDLAWLVMKARAPRWSKILYQRLLRRDGAYRPTFVEVAK